MHYQPLQSLSISADFTLLNNQNPLAGTNYDYSVASGVALVLLVAARGKIFDIQGSYSRSDLKSNIGYLEPGDSDAATFQLSRQRPYRHGAV